MNSCEKLLKNERIQKKDNDKLSFFCYNSVRIVDNSSRWLVWNKN